MNRRRWLKAGAGVAIVAGITGWWLSFRKPDRSAPPTPSTPEPTPEAPAPKAESVKPSDGSGDGSTVAPKAIEKSSIREGLPKDALLMESPEAAIARGTGLPWRKSNLEAVVTPDAWLGVRPLTEFGFGAAAGTRIAVSDAILRAHLGDYLPASGPIVVAIRGARADRAYNRFADQHALTIAAPDFLNFCCTIGVWDPETGLVSAYAASTVPNRTAIVTSALGVQDANMLLPGIFDYIPGSHSNYEDYGFPFSIQGALRQNSDGGGAGSLPALRAVSPTGMTGARTDTTRDDNLHCAETPLLEPYDRYSSEGCLVVAGRYTPKEGHVGPWAAFLNDAQMADRAAVTLILANATDLM